MLSRTGKRASVRSTINQSRKPEQFDYFEKSSVPQTIVRWTRQLLNSLYNLFQQHNFSLVHGKLRCRTKYLFAYELFSILFKQTDEQTVGAKLTVPIFLKLQYFEYLKEFCLPILALLYFGPILQGYFENFLSFRSTHIDLNMKQMIF